MRGLVSVARLLLVFRNLSVCFVFLQKTPLWQHYLWEMDKHSRTGSRKQDWWQEKKKKMASQSTVVYNLLHWLTDWCKFVPRQQIFTPPYVCISPHILQADKLAASTAPPLDALLHCHTHRGFTPVQHALTHKHAHKAKQKKKKEEAQKRRWN